VAFTLCDFGCVATTAELLTYLKQDSVVDIYLQSPGIQHVRRGVHACAHVTGDALAALRCGGVLDCISALEVEGSLASACGIDVPALHVRFRRGDHWARQRIAVSGRQVVAHWHERRFRRRDALTNVEERRFRRPVVPLTRVPPDEALAQALICVTPDEARRLIALTEADGVLSAERVARIIAMAPRRTRQALRRS